VGLHIILHGRSELFKVSGKLVFGREGDMGLTYYSPLSTFCASQSEFLSFSEEALFDRENKERSRQTLLVPAVRS
jgi:hypothetical protein